MTDVEYLELLEKIYQKDPLYYIETTFPDLVLWSGMRMIIDSVWKHKRTTVRASHGISKTITAALIGVTFLNVFPNSVVVTSAPTGRQVRDLLWKEIGALYEMNRNLAGEYHILRIPIAPDHYMMGFSTDNATSLEGYHAPAILWILDEAKGLPEWLYKSVEGSMTGGFSRVLETSTTDGADQQCPFRKHHTIERHNWNTIHLSAFDSPFVDPREYSSYEHYKNKKLYKYGKPKNRTELPFKLADEIQIATTEWIDDRIQDWQDSEPEMVETKVCGEISSMGVNNLIPLKWVESAIDAPIAYKPSDYIYYGLDVARMGDDRTVLFKTQNGKVFPCKMWGNKDLMETSGIVISELNADGIQPFSNDPKGEIHIDAIGQGDGVCDKITEEGYPTLRIISSARTYEPMKYFNLRSEMWWNVRDIFEQQYKHGHIISIPNDLLLIEELTGLKYKMHSNGTIQAERKDEFKKRLKRSPDKADSLIYALYKPPKYIDDDLYISSDQTIREEVRI